MINRSLLWFLLLLLGGLPSLVIDAQRPDAPEYAQRGPYAVGTRDYTIEDETRPLDIAVWYPALNPDETEEAAEYTYALFTFSGRALRDAPPDTANGPYPVVIFSHGSGGFRYQSLFLVEHLASYGFIVIAVDHPGNTLIESLNSETFDAALAPNYVQRPQDITRVIDYANTLNTGDDLTGILNTEQIAVSGHSFGGYTTLAAAGAQINFEQLGRYCAGATEDNTCFLLQEQSRIAEAAALDTAPAGVWPSLATPGIDAIIALAPWNGPIMDAASLADINIPSLFIVGTADSVTLPRRDAFTMFQQMSGSTRTLVTLDQAGHFIFVDNCSQVAIDFGFFDSCSDDVWDMARAHDLTNYYMTAFLLATFYDDETAATALETAQNPYLGVNVFQERGSTVRVLRPEVVAEYSHDPEAFTQGLLLHEGTFYESTGLYGESDLRQVDPETGEVLRIVTVDEAYFAEGLTLVDDRLIQITWQENTAFVYDRDTFEVIDTYAYEGEGWGLCYDGTDIYMSNGGTALTRRDPVTFEPLETIEVTIDGNPLANINELECVDDYVYANIWQTDSIVRIDKVTGIIDTVIDASNLRTPEERIGNVLNGIAYDAENDLFYITGKLWPQLYAVRFVE